MPQYTRVHRLLKVLTLIRSGQTFGRRWSAQSLAAECGVDERSIYRDLKELEKVGFPIVFDRDSRTYRVEGEVFLPPVQLDFEEALALAALCEQVAGAEQIAFLAPAWRGLSKIVAGLPSDVRDEVAKVGNAIVIRTAQAMPADEAPEDVYEAVRAALADRRTLVCVYDSLSGENQGEEFDFEPYALFFSVRAWYAVGFHAGRDAVRTLKLSRFSRLRLTERRYEIPADFSIDGHVGNAWRMIRGGEDHSVEIRFDAAFAETMSDTLWHRTQTIERHDDGSATFRCTVSGLDEIVWWALSMGPHCEVLAPAELRERVREAAAQTAALYAGPTPAHEGGRSP